MRWLPRVLNVGVLVLACASPGCTGARERQVIVSAAASLADVLPEVGKRFERSTGTTVVMNFGPSNALARQIAEGAAVDVFISADRLQMEHAKRSGRIRVVVDALSNQLVIVVPASDRTVMTSARDLLASRFGRIAMGDPAAVPAGVYGRQYLAAAGVWEQIEPRVLATVSVRAAMAAVKAGEADAGIVYRTDALSSTDVAIAFAVPAGEGPRIVYPAGRVDDGPNPEGGRSFLAYLGSDSARALFEGAGFHVLATRSAS